jgi:hypothetical protein
MSKMNLFNKVIHHYDKDLMYVDRKYVEMTQDYNAGRLLTRIVFWFSPDKEGKSKLRVWKNNEKGERELWLAKKREDWLDEIYMTSREVDRASKILENQDLIIKKVFKFNGDPTNHIQLNYEQFIKKLSEYTGLSYEIAETVDTTGYYTKCNNDITPSVSSITESTTESTSNINITEFQKTPQAITRQKGLEEICTTRTEKTLIKDFISVIDQVREEHKLNEKYSLTNEQVLIALQSLKELKDARAVQIFENDLLSNLESSFKDIVSREFRPLPIFSINKRTDKTSFLKMFIAYIKYFERFPTQDEMIWIQNARKSAKKPFSPSEVETGLELARRDEFKAGFVEDFKRYLWNARGNYVQVKQKQSTATLVTVVDDFSEYE